MRRNDDPHSHCRPTLFDYELGINRITFKGEDQRRQAQSNIRNREKRVGGRVKVVAKGYMYWVGLSVSVGDGDTDERVVKVFHVKGCI